MAQAIKGATEGHEPANLMAHAVWDALAAQLSGANATAGAAGAFSGELAARHIGAEMFPDTKLGDLNQDQKQFISLLGTMAAGIAGGVVGAASAGAVGYNTRGSVGRDGESWDEVGGGCEGTREQCAVRDGIRDGTRGPGHVMNGDGSEENSQPNVGKDIAKATDKEKAELGGTGSGTPGGWGPEDEEKGRNDVQNSGKHKDDQIWTETRKDDSVSNAYGHWDKHKTEFPEFKNSKQYVDATHDFVRNPPEGTLTKTRTNGDTLYYEPKTNTFASKDANGVPRTMFRPEKGIEYWNKQ
jgi:filamentous hemagglutinin